MKTFAFILSLLLLPLVCDAQMLGGAFKANAGKAPVAAGGSPVLTNGLIGWWKLNDGSGSTAVDSAPVASPHDGTLTNSPSWVAGKFGNALQFVGASSQAVGIAPVGLNGLAAATISVWFKKSSSGDNVEMGGNSTDADSIGITWFSDSVIYITARNSGVNYASISLSFDTSWHSLILVYDGGLVDDARMKLYIDGVLSSPSYSGTPPATLGNSGYINFGYNYATAANRYSTGFIDDVRIYSRALDASEVTTLQTNE